MLTDYLLDNRQSYSRKEQDNDFVSELVDPSQRILYESFCTYRQSEDCWPLFMPNENIYHLYVSLEDVCRGTVVKFVFDRVTIGDTTNLERCPTCLGSGIDEMTQCIGHFPTTSYMQCNQCTYGFKKGDVPRQKVHIPVQVPPGCPTGTLLRLPEQGDHVMRNRPCDLVLKVIVEQNENVVGGFRIRSGTLDLEYVLAVRKYELENGFNRHVQHPSGRVLNICSIQNIVEGTYMVCGHGVTFEHGSMVGNLYVKVELSDDTNVTTTFTENRDAFTSVPLLSMLDRPPTIVTDISEIHCS